MLRSMTGFGAAAAEIEGVTYAVEIRSVNNRYLKLTFKLPEAWSSAESEIEKIIRGRITRGSVVATVRMRLPEEQAAFQVNTAALRSYIDQLRLLEVEGDPSLRIELGSLLQLPGVCAPPEIEDMLDRTRNGLMDLIGQAVEAADRMRAVEGKALQGDLTGLCDQIDSQLAVVGGRSEAVLAEYHQRLTTRVAELTHAARTDIDADILAREVAIFAERCDIAEEVARLESHLDQFRSACDAREPVGRKLDFIAQEMLREANTIGSKSNDAEIARAVVEIKTAIDRIKEQAANAE